MKIVIDNIRKPKYSSFSSKFLSGKYRFRKDGIAYIYCGRPSPLGNPFAISRNNPREVVIEKFRKQLWKDIKQFDEKPTKLAIPVLEIAEMAATEQFPDGSELKGIVLLCYCNPKPCHAAVIARCIKWLVEKSTFYSLPESEPEEEENDDYDDYQPGYEGPGEYFDDNASFDSDIPH